MKKLLTFFSVAMVAIVSSAQTSVTVDGIKYDLDDETKTATVTYPNESKPNDSDNCSPYTGDVIIPAQVSNEGITYNVTAIGKYAFRSAAITSLTLPEGLVSIGEKAIYNTKISVLTVPGTATKFGQYAMAYNDNLTKVTFSGDCASEAWGEWILYRESPEYDIYMDCHAKPTVPDKYTFDHGYASRIHVYPDVFEEYANDPYWGGKYTIMPDMGSGLELKDFTVDGIKYKMTAEDKVSITYPTESKPGSSNPSTYSGDFVVPTQVTYEGKTYSVTGIGNYAFRYAPITSITLPEGLVSIGEEAIYKTQITEISLPNTLTTTGTYAMGYNSKLEKITVGSQAGTKEWGKWAFWRASGAYEVYMICDTKPEVPDIYTFDNDFASTIHIYPSLYLDYKTDYHWNCYNIVPDLVQDMSHEDLQNAIQSYSAKLPSDEEVGTAPGCYTATSVNAVKEALAAASALDENATVQQRNDALLQMIIAVDGLTINPLNEGYYYIENLYSNKYVRTGSDGYLSVKTFDESDARFCFKLTHKGSNWYIQSADEGKLYFGTIDEEGWLLSNSEPEYEQIITWLKGGVYTMQCQNGEEPSGLYGQSSGYVYVKDYTDDNNRAWWRFHPVQSGMFEQDFNIENIRVREYLANVTYEGKEDTKIKEYNIAPPVRRDVPEPATIFWNQNTSATAYQIIWSLNEDFSDAFTSEVKDETHYEIYNLLPNQTYYYKVLETVDGNPTEIINSSFTTTGQLRQIYAEGTGNMRDLGGWQTASGKPIKYGLIYRGAEWNGEYNLTPAGIAALRAIGMKAELDLRIDYEAAYITKSPLGDDVVYKRITNEDYYESGMQNRKDLYKQNLDFVFDCVKNEKPVYFHCHIGADRTGTLGVILEGLLGVSESDLYRDYELTTFSYYETHRYKENIDGILDYIKTLEGETLTDKFYTYCHNEVGMTAKEIADFRMKMLGVVYPADIESLISEALSNKETSVDLSGYVFEPEALTNSMPDGSNLLVVVSPESGITGTNIINNGVCENLYLTDGANFGTPYKFTATQASYQTQVNTYRTLILPFEAAVPAEFTAYKATSVEGTTVKLESVTSISANKPVLVSGNGMLVLTATDVAVTSEGKLGNGILRGVYQSAPAAEGSYVLQNQNNVIGFYHVGEAKPTIGAFRAYLNVPVSGIKAYFFEEEATGIKGLNDLKDSNVVIFNLAGQRLSKMQKGVNIVNGKKTLK